MKIVVTNFSCDNGHLGAFNLLTSKNRFIQRVDNECEDIGTDWLTDVTINDLKDAEGEKLIDLCRSISSRGHLNVIEI